MAARVTVPTPQSIAAAAELLRAGRLVAVPTETVYGLAADATNDAAVAAIFAAKERPRFNPLIVHVPDRAAAEQFAVFDTLSRRLAESFWPGPLTLVLQRRPDSGLSLLVSAGLDTIALRVPDHPVAQALLRASERPLAAPSANPSGRVSATTAAHVADVLGAQAALILDGGACPVGLESTVIAVQDGHAVLLRPGGLSRAEIERVAGPIRDAGPDDSHAPRSPGRLLQHYAPRKPLRLEAEAPAPDEVLLVFGPAPPGARHVIALSETGNLKEAAARLFAALHAADAAAQPRIAVMPIPGVDLGEAINDRLRRAAAQR